MLYTNAIEDPIIRTLIMDFGKETCSMLKRERKKESINKMLQILSLIFKYYHILVHSSWKNQRLLNCRRK